MSETQFFTAIAIAPTMSLIIVLVGYIVQNANLNARMAELRTDINSRFSDYSLRLDDLRDTLRAEMAKNHSELLARIAEHEHKHHT